MGITPYIVAELGVEHGGDERRLIDTICAAQSCGCDAVKLQYYTMDCLKDHARDQMSSRLLMQLERAEMKPHLMETVIATCGIEGIDWFGSVFCQHALDEYLTYNPIRWKSTARNLQHAVRWKKPAIPWWASSHCLPKPFCGVTHPDRSLFCVSAYPAMPHHYLFAGDLFEYDGISDHTVDFRVVCDLPYRFEIYEHHFTLDCRYDGPDRAISFTPQEMERYVAIIRSKHNSDVSEDNRWI